MLSSWTARVAAVWVGLSLLSAVSAQSTGTSGTIDTFASMTQTTVSSRELNGYYRSPFLFGGEYHIWSPFSDYITDFSIFEVAGSARFSPRSSPGIQPLVKVAYYGFNSTDTENPTKWDHYLISGGAGVVFASRFSRNFEVAGEISGSYSYSWFENVAESVMGYPGIVASVGGRISLVPSFNFSIDLVPQFQYLYGLGEVDTFNGAAVSIGFGVTYRSGQDPDAPQPDIRSIRFVQTDFPDAFAALQSWYIDNPLGTVTFENSDTRPIRDIEVLFFQPGFMDVPTPGARIDELAPGTQVTVDLPVGYSSEVFETEGVTPLTGEVIVRYARDGRPVEQRHSVTYDLHDKTAITWTDDRKMGAFITPSDSAVRNYMSYVRQQNREIMLEGIGTALQTAVLAYRALEELGIAYQIDPTNPFTEVQGDVTVVDSVSLARDTLTRLTGDCDDLTALYCTMLESAGVETAFVTTPGHIYVAVNTGVAPADFARVNPRRERTLVVNDSVWVPIEITMLGRGDFVDAWRYGADEWHAASEAPETRGFYPVRETQESYRPVGLRQTDLGLQYGNMERVSRGFLADIDRIGTEVLEESRVQVQESGDARSWNRYGILAAAWGRYEEADTAFSRAVSLERDYVSPRINLGSVSFLREDYGAALQAFESAKQAIESTQRVRDETRATVLVNLARAQYELGRYSEAQFNYEQAAEADAATASGFSYLSQGGIDVESTGIATTIGTDAPATGRAGRAATGPSILFAEDE